MRQRGGRGGGRGGRWERDRMTRWPRLTCVHHSRPLTIVFSVDREELLSLSLKLTDGLLFGFASLPILLIGLRFRSTNQVRRYACYYLRVVACGGPWWAVVGRVTWNHYSFTSINASHNSTALEHPPPARAYLFSASSFSLFSFASCASTAAFACRLNSSADFSSFALLLLIICGVCGGGGGGESEVPVSGLT